MPKIIHNGLTNKNAQRHSYTGGLGESQKHFAKYQENFNEFKYLLEVENQDRKYNKQQIIRLKNGEDKKDRETHSSRGFNQ